MGNSNLTEPHIKESNLEVFKYSSLYGRHELQGNSIVKKYELLESQNEAFLGLIQSYRKINHQSLMSIENFRLINKLDGNYFYELYFSNYSQTLASQIQIRKDKNPFTEHEIVKLIINLIEVLLIFHEKQFPYGILSPDKIAVKEYHQGYCIGIDILMNSSAYDELNVNKKWRGSKFLSPEELQIERYPYGFDRKKSTIFSLGLIALCTLSFNIFEEYHNLQQIVFNLRKNYSYQFCNLLQSMLSLQNSQRISMEDCLQSCLELSQPCDSIEEKIFIRGYNCVESLWLFDQKQEQSINRRWKSKQPKQVK